MLVPLYFHSAGVVGDENNIISLSKNFGSSSDVAGVTNCSTCWLFVEVFHLKIVKWCISNVVAIVRTVNCWLLNSGRELSYRYMYISWLVGVFFSVNCEVMFRMLKAAEIVRTVLIVETVETVDCWIQVASWVTSYSWEFSSASATLSSFLPNLVSSPVSSRGNLNDNCEFFC